MLEKIIAFSEKYNMIPRGSTIVCGLSGGADSICLTAALNELKDRLNISVEALHINHCLRGDESDSDEEFCRCFCKKYGIHFTSVSCNVTEFAEKNSLSIEEAARILRYNAFEKNSQHKLIATAHNANDNLETVIHNLTRGTAIKGLSGIPPIRDNIIRPLLCVTRGEIEEFLDERKLSFVTDSTNLSDDYTRNKIRHNVIPVLNEINGSVIKTSINSISAVRLENSFIEQEVNKALAECKISENSYFGLEKYHKAIRHRCIAAILTCNKLSYSYERLEAIDYIILNGGKINISGNIYFICDNNKLSLSHISEPVNLIEPISTPLKIGENKLFENKIVETELIKSNLSEDIKIINTKFAIYYLDYDKIIGTPLLRSRLNGDRIKLMGNSFTTSIKKAINEKISKEERPFLHFIADNNGTVWAEKIGIAQRAAPDSSTQKLLKITVRECKDG